MRRLCALDLREGFRSQLGWYIAAEALFVSQGIFFLLSSISTKTNAPCTFGNLMAMTLAGMGRYLPSPSEPFRFPVAWAAIMLLLPYITLDYPYHDLRGFGQKALAEIGSRQNWWLSKCVWVVLCVIVYWMLLTITMLAFSLFSGNGASLDVSVSLPRLLQEDVFIQSNSSEFLAFLFVAPCVLSAICLSQLCISLLVRPTQSYVITFSILFFSAFYYQCPLLPGNYLMSLRSLGLVSTGYPALQGLAVAVALASTSVLVGKAIFQRVDIFGEAD